VELNMVFNVIRSSDMYEQFTIEISGVEELMNLLQVCNAPIILHNSEVPTIEIYDGYRE
jgi:UDP-3-O-acyl-N-acetylglucosamine deacetylase